MGTNISCISPQSNHLFHSFSTKNKQDAIIIPRLWKQRIFGEKAKTIVATDEAN